MQDNAIIIKLQDSDVTSAQDDVDIEGIIHIPSIEYDHCVQEVQVPGQSFFNELYLNVQDLEIGGSGLPLIINLIRVDNEHLARTQDFSTATLGTGTNLTLQQYDLLLEVDDLTYNYSVYFLYCTEGPITYTTYGKYYILHNVVDRVDANDNFISLCNNNSSNTVITTRTNFKNNLERTPVYTMYKNWFSFDWGN